MTNDRAAKSPVARAAARIRFYFTDPRAAGLRLALLVVITLACMVNMLPRSINSGVGHDFDAYWMASERMISEGQPYSAEMLAGPIDAQAYDGYRYPPLLAQAFTLLHPLGPKGALVFWTILVMSAFSAALVLARRRSRAAISPRWTVVAVSLFLILAPGYAGAINGSLSPLLALPVALALSARPSVWGWSSAVAALLKIAPGATVLPLLATPGRTAEKARGLAIGAAVLLGSVLVAPAAWASFIDALPNIISTSDPVGAGANPAAIARMIGLHGIETAIRLLTFIAAGALLFWSALLARKPERRHAAIAAALIASFLIPWIWWNHYLLALAPIAVVSWQLGSKRVRGELLISFLLVSVLGTGLLGHLGVAPAAFLVLDAARRTRLPVDA